MVSIFSSGHFSMQPDEVNKLKEIIKNLKSVKLNFAEIRKEMDRFYECQCVNGRKPAAISNISKVIEFQIGSARHEYQQSLNDGVLSTKNDRKNAKARIRNKFDRTMDNTNVTNRGQSIFHCNKNSFQNRIRKYRAEKKHKSRRFNLYKQYFNN